MFIIKLKFIAIFKNREKFNIIFKNREIIDFNKDFREKSFKKRFSIILKRLNYILRI